MEGRNRLRNKVDVHDVNFIFRAEWQHRQAGQKYECLHHVELRSLGMAAIAQNYAGPKIVIGTSGRSCRIMCSVNFLVRA